MRNYFVFGEYVCLKRTNWYKIFKKVDILTTSCYTSCGAESCKATSICVYEDGIWAYRRWIYYYPLVDIKPGIKCSIGKLLCFIGSGIDVVNSYLLYNVSSVSDCLMVVISYVFPGFFESSLGWFDQLKLSSTMKYTVMLNFICWKFHCKFVWLRRWWYGISA